MDEYTGHNTLCEDYLHCPRGVASWLVGWLAAQVLADSSSADEISEFYIGQVKPLSQVDKNPRTA